MNARRFLVFLIPIAFAACSGKTEMRPVDYVDPFIGTDGHGHTYPGATTPFGAVQLSPDNYRNTWDACSGYHYSQDKIYGFSHTHLSGTGCADLGDILFHPTSRNVDLSRDGYIFDCLPYRHSNEEASPGYYSVYFHKDSIKAELTTTRHCGWHRYTWAKGRPHDLIIDMRHSLSEETVDEVEIFQTSPSEIRGMRKTTGWTPDQYVYFVAQFSRNIEKIRFIDGHKEMGAAEDCKSKDRQVILSFGEDGGPVVAKVGLSVTGYPGAEYNLMTECADHLFDFDRVRRETEETWNDQLLKIMVEGGNKSQRRTFYTALYHYSVVPNIVSDADKIFRRNNGNLAKLQIPKDHYSTLSLWDTFRAWLPLSTLIDKRAIHDIVCSCLEMYDATGELPIWPLSSGETRCMIGYHSIPFIVDAILKGLVPEVNTDYALEAMVNSSNKNENGSDLYTSLGYIPANLRAESVSTMLEYCYDDWCIAKFAETVGRAEIADDYYKRAKNYVKIFDGSTGFFRGRNTDGVFLEPFNAFEPSREYTEATAWQYRFFTPHDFAGLAQLLGGTDKLAQALDDCFAARAEIDGFKSDITGMIGQYVHGNEPSHHISYAYNYVGQPWKTQEWTRRICRELYTDKADGLCGNEDCGQMSAWYVMTALGLYEVCPGSGQFTFTTPMFDKATVNKPFGKPLVITANDPQRNPYIRKVTLDGKEITKAYLTWEELMTGQELHFELGKKPDKNLWTEPEAAPYSMTVTNTVSKPWYKADDLIDLFSDSITVTLGSLTEGAQVRYTLDGNEPTAESTLYSGSIEFTGDAFIRARAFKEGCEPSEETAVKATKAEYLPADHSEHSEHGVNYSFWHGDFSKVADIETKGEFQKSGTLSRPSTDSTDVNDYYGFIFSGWIYIPETRIWQFSLACDDGCVLCIDGKVVVNNDGTHAVSHVKGLAALEEGFHPYTIKYLESCEDEAFYWGWWPAGATEPEMIPDENLYIK